MEGLDQVKKVAEANAIVAAGERELAKKIKILAKSESKGAKARRDFTKRELDLIKIRLEAAETNKNLVNKKLNFRHGGILQFNEEELKKEVKSFIYLGNLAKAQENIAGTYNQIAALEEQIAENKEKLADLILNSAKIREKLGKKQLAYIKAKNEQLEMEKISKIEKEIETLYKDLQEETMQISAKGNEIRNKENGLADLNSIACSKLSEQEKIRPT